MHGPMYVISVRICISQLLLLLPFHRASAITIIPLVTSNAFSFHSTSLQSTVMTASYRF